MYFPHSFIRCILYIYITFTLFSETFFRLIEGEINVDWEKPLETSKLLYDCFASFMIYGHGWVSLVNILLKLLDINVAVCLEYRSGVVNKYKWINNIACSNITSSIKTICRYVLNTPCGGWCIMVICKSSLPAAVNSVTFNLQSTKDGILIQPLIPYLPAVLQFHWAP